MNDFELLDLVKKAYAKKTEKETLEKQIADLKANLDEVDKNFDELKTQILTEMVSQNLNEKKFASDKLVVSVMSKSNVGYKNENEVIKYLKENYNGSYIKVKTTESLDKTALKKAIKSDSALKESLDPMIEETKTTYAVVTDFDNYEKMLEHIEAGKTK